MIWLKSADAAPRRTTTQSLQAAAFFSLQVGVAAFAISAAYAHLGQAGVTWAIVSAILVIYPGITQSLSAALLRIAANLLGSAIGFAVGSLAGTDTGQIVLALVGTIFAGELLRMDLALRTACVATVIVMSANEHNIRLSVEERLIAVAAGCGVALAVQLAGWPLRKYLPFVANAEVKEEKGQGAPSGRGAD